jgi:hypothetical protein
MTLAAATALVPGSFALAQTPRYRVVDITEIGFPPTDLEGTAGINNYGEVAFGFKVSNVIHAFAWLPEANHGRSAGLHDLAALTESGESIAHDINMEGIVAGQYGGIGINAGAACVWPLASSVTRTGLGNFGGSNAWSMAWALNDEADPVVVGHSGRTHHCECEVDEQREEDVTRAFKIRFESSLGSLIELTTGGSTVGGATGAYDLTTPSSGLPDIVGYRGCDTCAPIGCASPTDAAKWDATGTIGSLDDLNNAAEARAINSSGNAAGYVLEAGSGFGVCYSRATYWVGSTDTQIGPSGSSTVDTHAEGLNNLSPPQIVGRDIDNDHAVIFENLFSTWVMTDLNDEIGTCSPAWTLLHAHDINDSGWIICVGSRIVESVTRYHALLLVPYNPCPGDVTGNTCVDTDDLLAVINGWGSCDQGEICWGDLTGNCVVDTDDLLMVTNNWCVEEDEETCEDECCVGCSFCEESFLNGPSAGPPTLADLIVLVLNSELSPEMQAQVIEELTSHFAN